MTWDDLGFSLRVSRGLVLTDCFVKIAFCLSFLDIFWVKFCIIYFLTQEYGRPRDAGYGHLDVFCIFVDENVSVVECDRLVNISHKDIVQSHIGLIKNCLQIVVNVHLARSLFCHLMHCLLGHFHFSMFQSKETQRRSY